MSEEAPSRCVSRGFVGRARELTELCAGLDDARGGRGRFFLITGQPGIGKTWLTDEVAMRAAAGAMTVLRAGCWEGGGAPPYWPFVQIVRAALGVSPVDAAKLAPDLTQLVPELQVAGPGRGAAAAEAPPNPEQSRFRLFESVATVLRNLAAARPLVLVIEDLHDADQPSLMMLRFVAGQLKSAAVMVLATYRDFEMRRSPTLSRQVGDLLREGTQIPLSALSRDDAARMIEAHAGVLPNPKLVSEIYQATAGNPLFIDGLVRVLAAERRLNGSSRLNLAAFRVPDGVREALRRWLALLSERSVLIIAATIGQEFELRCLQHVTGAPNQKLLDSLRAAADVGLVTQLSTGSFRFTHALIRNALCEELNSADRAAVHLKIGAAIEELYRVAVDVHAASLSHHFHVGGDIDKAIEYAIRAGEAARTVFAYEEAIVHWHSALELISERGEDRPYRTKLLERAGELLGLATSEGAGQFKYLGQALKLYREVGRLDPLARSDLVARVEAPMTGWLSEPSDGDDPVVEDSLGAASPRAMEIRDQLGDGVLWARDAIPHANSLFGRGCLEEAFSLIRRASAMADGLNDGSAAFGILSLWSFMLNCLCDPVEGAARVQVALTKPWSTGSPLRGLLLSWLWRLEIVKGKMHEGEELFAPARGEPLVEGHLAFYRGELERADLIFAQTMVQARQGGIRLRTSVFGLWSAKARRALGQYSAAETILQEGLAVCLEGPHLPFEVRTRAELALLCAETARPEMAHPHLVRCREVMSAGEDWRGLAGHVARSEGAVAAARQDFEASDQQFATAVEIYGRYQARFEEAEAHHFWGRALISAGDREQALEKLDGAAELYRRHGAGEFWLEKVHADRSRAQALAAQTRRSSGGRNGSGNELVGVGSLPVIDARASFIAATFSRQGEYWTVSWANTESKLKDRKGLHYIARLLRYPGQEFAVQDLVSALEPAYAGAASSGAGASAPHSASLGDAGAALNAAAKAQYKHRLEDLRDELELAEQHNDIGRAASVRIKIELVEAEVAAAVGLGGRDRKSASHAERTRLAVTKAIKGALRRIRDADPELARHLALSIQTGYFCAYIPRQPVIWDL